jgi:2,3-bisphosphoglycerate-independent phosphoglycerate mutase
VSAEWLAKNGMRTFACSETQKFGHVTFFWNGNRSGYFDEKLETYVEIPSDNVPFNTTPAMKALEITAAGIEALRSKRYDVRADFVCVVAFVRVAHLLLFTSQVVRVNYANPDMVGHTGDLEATKKACEVVDAQVGILLKAVEELGGVFLLTADHGNADDMVQREKKTNKPVMQDGKIATLTSHTLAPVPVAIGGPGLPASVRFRDDLPVRLCAALRNEPCANLARRAGRRAGQHHGHVLELDGPADAAQHGAEPAGHCVRRDGRTRSL